MHTHMPPPPGPPPPPPDERAAAAAMSLDSQAAQPDAVDGVPQVLYILTPNPVP